MSAGFQRWWGEFPLHSWLAACWHTDGRTDSVGVWWPARAARRLLCCHLMLLFYLNSEHSLLLGMPGNILSNISCISTKMVGNYLQVWRDNIGTDVIESHIYIICTSLLLYSKHCVGVTISRPGLARAATPTLDICHTPEIPEQEEGHQHSQSDSPGTLHVTYRLYPILLLLNTP